MEPKKMKLYSYFYSSCSFRVRIALHLKGLDYEYHEVDLGKGEQRSSEFLKINPLGHVPVLVDEDIVISDSFAILMYLEEKYPQCPLLPCDLQRKAINFQAANIVSSSIQPHQNMGIVAAKIVSSGINPLHHIGVLKYIRGKVSPDELALWVKYHIGKGFAALENLLKDCAGKYATGDEVYLADLFLAPQIHSAITRFSVDMTLYPTLSRLNEAYSKLTSFQYAMPEKQPDKPVEYQAEIELFQIKTR